MRSGSLSADACKAGTLPCFLYPSPQTPAAARRCHARAFMDNEPHSDSVALCRARP